MEVFNLILAVAMMLTHLARIPLFFTDVYQLTISGVETAVCDSPAASPYLESVCGTVDALLPDTPQAAVAYDVDFPTFPPAAVHSGFPGAEVFDPTLTGCIVNCTVVDEPAPAPVYFGPFFPPGDLIIAPKFELWAPPPPPVCPWTFLSDEL